MGVALTGALFNGLESAKLERDMTAAGASLTAADRGEVRGLLSGEHDAIEKLTSLAPDLAHRMEAIVGDAFVHALVAGMILTLILSIVGAASSFIVRQPALARGQHTDLMV